MSKAKRTKARGFGKPKPKVKPDLKSARQAGVLIAAKFPGRTVELKHCLDCGDYFHVIAGKDSEGCDTCSSLNFEVESQFLA